MKSINKYQKTLRRIWDQRAKENAYSWVDHSKEAWDKHEYYEKGLQEVLNRAIPLLREKKFSNEDLRTMKALDFGCGTGRLTAGLAKYFGSVDGVDVSEEMIKIAKNDHKEMDNVGFFSNNGYDLKEFPNNYYDFVFSFAVFQHVPRKSVVINYLKEIFRVLATGGYMKVQVRGYPANIPSNLASWRYHGFNSFYVALSRVWKLPILRIFFYNTVLGAFFKEKELKKTLKNIGFTDIELTHEKIERRNLWASARKPQE